MAEEENRSFILIEFKEQGSADLNIRPVNVTLGQMQAAAFSLSLAAEKGTYDAWAAIHAKMMQEQAMMQSLMKDGKLKQ
jgi:hypothetical protein